MKDLASVLQQNIGNVLTEELALGILLSVSGNQNEYINITDIPPEDYGDAVINVEFLKDCLDEIKPVCELLAVWLATA